MTKSSTATIILAVGAIVLAYYILKSWGIIQPMTLNQKSLFNQSNSKPVIKLENIQGIDLTSLQKVKQRGFI